VDALTIALADARGRLNLSGVAVPGQHYIVNVEIDADGERTGAVRLTPVNVATTAIKRTDPAALPEDEPLPGI
jgi:hypothetical protein